MENDIGFTEIKTPIKVIGKSCWSFFHFVYGVNGGISFLKNESKLEIGGGWYTIDLYKGMRSVKIDNQQVGSYFPSSYDNGGSFYLFIRLHF